MKSSKFSESQIIKALKENENGKTAEQISRESGIKKATLCFFPPEITPKYKTPPPQTNNFNTA
ncbi:MAG: hypothetical protein IPN97_14675 [Saprospiraceae bacterium]|nr:hypothetical protein [Saprospiraceae bacterium]